MAARCASGGASPSRRRTRATTAVSSSVTPRRRSPCCARAQRRALPADAPAVVAVHVRSWQAAHRGLLPDAEMSAPAFGLVQGHGGADESLQRLIVDLLALVEVDGAPRVSLETGVEEARRVLERRPLGEGHLHDVLVRLAG